ncbi:MAG: PDC sensor domain-containing protein, partial [Casimicrobium sp.]
MSSAIPNEPPTSPKRRLRTLLTVPFTALILAPAMIIALTSLYTGLRAVDTLSERVITDVSSRVEQAAVHQLEEAAITLRSSVPDPVNTHGSAIALFEDMETLEKKFFELTSATRTTSYIFYGAEDGSFLGVDRGRARAQAAATVRAKGAIPEPRRVYSARTPGDRTRLQEVESRIFDPRERPWYTQAKAANRLTWTPVYVSFASNALVTTASQPVVTREAKLLGVLAADVELSELSAFMKNVSVSENGVAFIVDRDGLLVASSAPGDPFKQDGSAQTRVKARDHGDEVERAAADWWQQIRSEAIPSGAALRSAKINSDKGDSIDVAVRRVSRIDGVDWDVVVAIPRSDLTAPIVRSATIMFVVIFTALIAALQLGLWIVNRVTGDVDQLVKSANNYTIDGNQYVEPKTTLQETSVLSGAFVGMFRRLRDSLSTIRKQNEDLAALNTTLEERVERRTRQLENKNFELTAEVSRREQLENELREASEAATKQADDKVRFMAMLSHEL